MSARTHDTAEKLLRLAAWMLVACMLGFASGSCYRVRREKALLRADAAWLAEHCKLTAERVTEEGYSVAVYSCDDGVSRERRK